METSHVISRDLGVTGPVVLDDRPWAVVDNPYGRTEYRILRSSLRANVWTSMVRWSGGIRIPTHRHLGNVYVHTLTGRWHYEEYDWVATTGSFLVELAETEHTLVVDEDTEILVTTHNGLIDVDAAGNVHGYTDAQSSLERYVGYLASVGLPVPDDLIID